MALEPAVAAKLTDLLGKRWASKKCPMCQTNNWELVGYITLIAVDSPGKVYFAGPTLPCAAAICQHCGNTILINLVAAGLVRGA